MEVQESKIGNLIDTKELRLGNWVYDGERTQFPMQVVAIGKDWVHLDFPGNEGGVWEADIKDLRLIPLTKEVLEKAGFVATGTCYHDKSLGDNKRMLYYEQASLLCVWYDSTCVIFECHGIRYLHQLQNAYYLATGQELEVKL